MTNGHRRVLRTCMMNADLHSKEHSEVATGRVVASCESSVIVLPSLRIGSAARELQVVRREL